MRWSEYLCQLHAQVHTLRIRSSVSPIVYTEEENSTHYGTQKQELTKEHPPLLAGAVIQVSIECPSIAIFSHVNQTFSLSAELRGYNDKPAKRTGSIILTFLLFARNSLPAAWKR